MKKRNQNLLLDAVLVSMTEVMYLQDGDHNIIHMNEAGCRYFGCQNTDIVGKKCYSLFGLDKPCLNCPRLEAFQKKKPVRKDFFHAANGSWFNISVSPTLDQYNELNDYLVVFRDVSKDKHHREIIGAYGEDVRTLINRLPLGCITWDNDFKVVNWNPSAEDIFGFSAADAYGKHPYEMIVPKELIPKTDAVKSRLMNGDETAHRQGKNITKDGREIICDWTNTPLRDKSGKVKGVLSVVQDVTDQVQNSEVLTYRATHDSLTGLPNRHWFKSRLAERLEEAKQNNDSFAVALIDLNKFKDVNDTLGHHAGDQLLKQLSARFKNELLDHEIARLGGDEFVFMFPIQNGREDIEKKASLILELFDRPFEVVGLAITISTSLGISYYPEHAVTDSELLRKADIAMYQAKDNILEFCIYEESQDLYSQERLQLISDLRYAITDHQLRMVYQPKLSLKNNQLVGYEALVRWDHPEKGLITPNRFIPFAENSDLIAPLTKEIFTMCLSQWRKLADLGRNIPISVNLCPRLLLDKSFPDLLRDLMVQFEIPTGALEIELTETAIIADPLGAGKILQQIVNQGVRISIDDYGTGYSSLTMLNKLPIDVLKIDMSFIQNMLNNDQEKIIVKSTIELAHSLGLIVIAEGVEDEQTLRELNNMGCDEVQGYFISRPMDEKNMIDWIPPLLTIEEHTEILIYGEGNHCSSRSTPAIEEPVNGES